MEIKFIKNKNMPISTHNIASETGTTTRADVDMFLKENYPGAIKQEATEEEKIKLKPGPKPAEKLKEN
jgi:hypothetical protein